MVAAVLQQIVCYLCYNMYATGDGFFSVPIYFPLAKQRSKIGFRAAAPPASCLAVTEFAEEALGADFGGILGFFSLPVLLSQSTEEGQHNKHPAV